MFRNSEPRKKETRDGRFPRLIGTATRVGDGVASTEGFTLLARIGPGNPVHYPDPYPGPYHVRPNARCPGHADPMAQSWVGDPSPFSGPGTDPAQLPGPGFPLQTQ
ncbi:hypothetical protein V6N11_002267 [Hibiscus sabdariffa]|uniref:Uncharacterized protein n=1 Tax=Hibiscus sabdariffa TaxID=183260 RepID=A0ABR2QUX7_9ROSI